MTNKIENVKIDGTFLGINDHGLFDAWLYLSGNGWGVGFGGFALDAPIKKDGKFLRREDTDGTVGEYIRRILQTVGVEKWEDLPGKFIRVESEGLGGGVKKIGNLLREEWFNPSAWFEGRGA